MQGGVLESRRLIYTNSVEAFQTSLKAGFKIFEFDVWGLVDNDIIFAHDEIMISNWQVSRYNPLKFTEMLSIIAKNPELKVMLDIKWNTFFDYKKILDSMEFILSKTNEKWNYNVKKQLFVQTYNRETLEYAVQNEWKCLLTSYRNFEGSWFKKSAYLCCEFGVCGMLINVQIALKAYKYLKFLKDKNIPILAFSTDNIDEYSKLKNIGIDSVLTNFLRPRKRFEINSRS